MFCDICVDFFYIYGNAGEYEFKSSFFFSSEEEVSEFLVEFHVAKGGLHSGAPLLLSIPMVIAQ